MSTLESRGGEAREAVAGLLAASAIFVSLVGLAYKPARIIPVAAIVALVASVMTERHSRLAALAVAAAVVCWTIGMTIAVVTERPLY